MSRLKEPFRRFLIFSPSHCSDQAVPFCCVDTAGNLAQDDHIFAEGAAFTFSTITASSGAVVTALRKLTEECTKATE